MNLGSWKNNEGPHCTTHETFMPPHRVCFSRIARAPRRRVWAGLTLAMLGLLVAVVVWYLNLLPLALHWAIQRPQGLAGYRVSVEARPIEGLSDNVSGLTFNHRTGTLWAVINRPPQVAEISPEGRLLRRMPLPGLRDPEGITHVEGDLYVIADEASHLLHPVRIGAGAAGVKEVGWDALPMPLQRWDNLGLEGVSWDERRQRLWVVNEKWPRRVSHVEGLPGDAHARVSDWRHSSVVEGLLSDLSSLTTDPDTGNLLVLSDESALVLEVASDGRWLGVLPLWRGVGGLSRKVPQAEGLAMGPDRALYIVSEPNLFYRFERIGP